MVNLINRYSDPAFVGSPKFYNCGVIFYYYPYS